MTQRQPRGRPFKPGQSGNPSGRPKADYRFLDLLGEATDEGRELIDIALAFARDASNRPADRIQVIKFLLELLFGKATRRGRRSEPSAPPKMARPPKTAVDLSRLTPEERRRLDELQQKIAARPRDD